MRGELGLRVFGKRVLRKIFEPNGDKATEERRKLHNKELCNLYCSPKVCVIKSERMG